VYNTATHFYQQSCYHLIVTSCPIILSLVLTHPHIYTPTHPPHTTTRSLVGEPVHLAWVAIPDTQFGRCVSITHKYTLTGRTVYYCTVPGANNNNITFWIFRQHIKFLSDLDIFMTLKKKNIYLYIFEI